MSQLITTILPTRNNGNTLRAAIDSILNQTHSDLELIVVDDYSDDETQEIVAEYVRSDSRVRYTLADFDDPKRLYRGKDCNAGYSARNTGLKLAKGDWITFQDGDDLSLLNRLEVQLMLVEEYKVSHLSTGCFWLEEDKHIGRSLNWQHYLQTIQPNLMNTNDILELALNQKGLLHNLPDAIYRLVPFRVKQSRFTQGLFYPPHNHQLPYPNAANNPFFKANLVKSVRFNPLSIRRFPSMKGRGADKDFNFRLALDCQSSASIDIPLYGWRTPTPFTSYVNDFLL